MAASSPGGNLYAKTTSEATSPGFSVAVAYNRDGLDRQVAAIAAQAQQTADALVPRVEQIEVMAGLAPGEVTDAQTANLISQPGTSTRDALTAASAQAAAAVIAQGVQAAVGREFAASLDFDTDQLVVAVCGDSTGNDNFEWVRKLTGHFVDRYPNRRVEYALWSDTSQSYPAPSVLNAGVGYEPGQPAGTSTLLRDTFTRTAPDLLGTSPDTGTAWTGSSGSIGGWSVDGSKAVKTSTAPGAAPLADLGPHGDVTLTLSQVTLSTLGDTANREFNAYIKSASGGSTNDSLRVRFQIAASTGAVSWHLFKMSGGTTTVLATGPSSPILANSASTTFSLVLSLEGRTLSARVNSGAPLTYTLTEQEATQYAGNTFVGFGASAGSLAGMSISEATATAPRAEAPARGPLLRVWNGSHPGSTLAYQAARITAMIPEPPSLLILNSGHNYKATDPAMYLSAVDQFVADVRAVYPGTPVIVTSQNPEFPTASWPESNTRAHAERLSALRIAAAERGWGYVPGFERFASQPDGGRAWVMADGIHPNYDPNGPHDGSDLWLTAWTAYFDGMSYRTDIAG